MKELKFANVKAVWIWWYKPISMLVFQNSHCVKSVLYFFCSQGYDQKRKLFCTNSFVLAQLSAKTFYIEQLTVKSSIQWYRMTLIWRHLVLAVILASMYLFLYLHLLIISDLLFSMLSSLCRAITSFSLRHRRHRLEHWLHDLLVPKISEFFLCRIFLLGLKTVFNTKTRK